MTTPPGRLASCVLIPARLGAKRLPRKLLLPLGGKPILQHTFEAACRAARPSFVGVVTDSPEVRDVVEAFGGTVFMSDPDLPTGTDRVAVAAAGLPQFDIVVNLQGDEPLTRPDSIDRVIQALEEEPDVPMATLAAPVRDRGRWLDPSCVKVVFDARGRALYFSRAPIPHLGHGADDLAPDGEVPFHQHLGIYAYRRAFLLAYSQLPASSFERLERLEQLRALQAGHTILVRAVDDPSPGVNTPEDYEALVRRMAIT